MENLFNFIDDSTFFIKNKIVEIIENDDDWLNELGILNSYNDAVINLKELIVLKLEDIENQDRTDKIIQYILNDYILGEDEKYSIFYGICEADSYSRNSALYVFKFDCKFFCYYLPERSLITTNPIPFCKEAIQDEIKHFEIEKENMKDEYFDESDFNNKLNFNFTIKY
jgi:hypothetical protein